ncbi:MAG: hypothetical protein M1281_10490 [Chloroflexi bacterium]|nr:hypothetical protein [Chloroflexota bacterium]
MDHPVRGHPGFLSILIIGRFGPLELRCCRIVRPGIFEAEYLEAGSFKQAVQIAPCWQEILVDDLRLGVLVDGIHPQAAQLVQDEQPAGGTEHPFDFIQGLIFAVEMGEAVVAKDRCEALIPEWQPVHVCLNQANLTIQMGRTMEHCMSQIEGVDLNAWVAANESAGHPAGSGAGLQERGAALQERVEWSEELI